MKILTGIEPDIIEQYKPLNEYVINNDSVVERPIISENTGLIFFTVSFPVEAGFFSADQLQMIYEVIKNEKPAHSTSYLQFVKETIATKRDYAVIGHDIIE